MSLPDSSQSPPRMLVALSVTITLFMLSGMVQAVDPGGLAAVSLFKAHLMALGGWGGYWLDRALFPYARPHTCLDFEPTLDLVGAPADPDPDAAYLQVATSDFNTAQLRRAIVVAACLICVGLGA